MPRNLIEIDFYKRIFPTRSRLGKYLQQPKEISVNLA